MLLQALRPFSVRAYQEIPDFVPILLSTFLSTVRILPMKSFLLTILKSYKFLFRLHCLPRITLSILWAHPITHTTGMVFPMWKSNKIGRASCRETGEIRVVE